MTTPNLTIDQAIGQLKLTDEQLRIWRKVTLVLGFRNVGKALSAIAPRKGAVTGTVGAQVTGYVLTGQGKAALAPKQRGADVWKCRKGEKRNPAGGLMCATPGGYERQWGNLVGVGLNGKKRTLGGMHVPDDERAAKLWAKDWKVPTVKDYEKMKPDNGRGEMVRLTPLEEDGLAAS